jgi:hypothetical protein
MEETNKPRGEEPTPEVARLLKMLEMQTAAQRQRGLREPSALQTPAFRYGVLIAIAVFAFGSLGVLEWVLSQMARPGQPGVGLPAQGSAAGNLHGNPASGR